MQHPRKIRFSMPRVINSDRLFISRQYAQNLHADANNEVLHIIDGSMVLRLQSGEEYPAKKNDTLFIPHGIMHKDIFEVHSTLEMFHINFKWAQADTFFAAAKPDCLYRIPAIDKNEILLLFDMFRLNRYECASDTLLADARLAHLLAIAWRNVFAGDEQKRERDAFSRLTLYAQDYMKAHLSEELTIDLVARQMRVSRATLVRAFRHSCELSFNQYLRAVRMQYAYSLLRERALNTADCAAQCGFSDPAYFAKIFKKHFGFLPKDCK